MRSVAVSTTSASVAMLKNTNEFMGFQSFHMTVISHEGHEGIEGMEGFWVNPYDWFLDILYPPAMPVIEAIEDIEVPG